MGVRAIAKALNGKNGTLLIKSGGYRIRDTNDQELSTVIDRVISPGTPERHGRPDIRQRLPVMGPDRMFDRSRL